MAILKDEEEQKGQGTSQVLGQGMGQPQQPAAQQAQPQAPSSGPANIGGSSATQPSAPVKAMPKQQKAGTGTFANLKSYLQAAQSGGQQKVAQAATQQVQSATTGAQKGIQQAQKTFGQRMDAASLANMNQAESDVGRIIGAARGVTYQAPQQTPALTQEQINAQNEARANYTADQRLEKVGGPAIRPMPYYADRIGINPPLNPIIQERDNYLKTTLGDKYQDFKNELDALTKGKSLADYSNIVKDRTSIYEKYGVDTTKLPGYNSGKNLEEYARSMLQKQDSTELEESATPTQPQAPAATQQYFSPEDQQRFAEIINAEYKGPQSLQQAGLYEEAARKSQIAQLAGERSRTASGREQLLRDLFGRGRDYSQGASKLDALLLNTSQQGVGQVQQAGQQAANISQALQAAQNLSSNEAATRAADIEKIRTGARTAFTTQQEEELGKTKERIAGAKSQAEELKNYFTNLLKDTENKPVDISATEAALLGIDAGEGLYKLTGDQLLNLQDLRDEKLISKTERARLEALSQLAGLASDKGLSTEFFTPYQDASLAGTQSVLSALNAPGIRETLNKEEKAFLDRMNMDVTGYGTGSAKYDRGMFRGRGTVKDSAEFSQNMLDLLEKSGYNVTPEDRQVMSNPEVIKAIMQSAQQGGTEQEILARASDTMQANMPTGEGVTSTLTQGGSLEGQQLDTAGLLKTAGEASLAQTGGQALAGLAATGFGAPAASVAPYYLLAKLALDADFRDQIAGLTGSVLGKEAGQFAESALSTVDAAAGLTDMLGTIGTLGLNESFGSDLFGGGKSSAKKKAARQAQEKAGKDLQKKIQSELESSGFERRASILDKGSLESGLATTKEQQTKLQQDLTAKQNELAQAEQAKKKYANFDVDSQITNLEQSLKNKRLKPAQKQYLQSQLNEMKNAKNLIATDTTALSKDIESLSGQSKDIAGKLKQQEGLLSRASSVQERNAGLLELLKRLDTTNV